MNRKITFLFTLLLLMVGAKSMAQTPLTTWVEVKNGNTYALVNVQPASVGKNYLLVSQDGVLTPVNAADYTVETLTDAAKFVAEKQTDGKFAFKNVLNEQYLAWKAQATNANSTGENNNSGFVSTVEKWSSWKMNKSTRQGWTETYWLSCDNRKSNLTSVGTLLIDNGGNWNAANTEWTTEAYSNNYGLVLLAEATTYDITYNYKFNGETVLTETVTDVIAGGEYPALNLPYGVNAQKPEGTVTATETKDIECTLAENYPFKYCSDYASATWYMLTIRDIYYPYYDAETNEFPNTGGQARLKEDKAYFAFQGTPWGVKILNRGAGEGKAMTGTPTANNSALGMGDFADGLEFIFENNSGHFVFAAKTNRIAHINNVAGNKKLGFWTDAKSATDGGSTLKFDEADISLDAPFKNAKADALAAIANMTKLTTFYTSDAIETATTGINAITYDATSATEVEAAITSLNGIMATLYASAEGKMFTMKSLSSYNTRDGDYYLIANNGSRMTAAQTLNLNGVFTLHHSADNKYKVEAVKTQTYLPTTGGASGAIQTTTEENAGLWTIEATDNADGRCKVSCVTSTISDSQGGIHLDGSKNIVVWGPSGAASMWNIDAISQEDYDNMVETTITWQVKDGETILASQTLENCVKGQEYTTSIAFAYVTLQGETTVTAGTEDQTITLTYTLNEDCPIQFAESFDAVETWYNVNVHSNQTHWMYTTEENTLAFNGEAPETGDEYKWAFIGNPFGVKVVNKATGEMLSDDTPCGMTSEENVLKMGTIRTQGGNGIEVVPFSLYKTAGNYYNFHTNALNRWNDNDNGSAFQVMAINPDDAIMEQFMQEYESLQQQFTQVNNATLNNEEYQDEKYASVIEEMTPVLNGIQQNMAALQTWANESYEAHTLAADVDEILASFEGIQTSLTQFLNTFNDKIANLEAMEQFMQEYESLSQQFSQVYNTTVNNEEYAKYTAVIDEMTPVLNGIQQNMAALQTWAEESYEGGSLADDLEEILSQFESIQTQLTTFMNSFQDAIKEYEGTLFMIYTDDNGDEHYIKVTDQMKVSVKTGAEIREESED